MKRIEVIVDDRLRLDPRELGDVLLDDLRHAFTHKNPKHGALKAMDKRWAHAEPEFISTWRTRTEKRQVVELTLPRGGAARLREVLGQHGTSAVFRDQRVFISCPMPAHRMKLRDYQERQVETALRVQNCVLRAPTGSGKTAMSMGLISKVGTPTLVVVMTAALADQWLAVAQRDLGLSQSSIGVIRGGKFRLLPVTLAMNQSLYRLDAAERDAVRSYFGAVIFDEVHLAAARTFVENVDWMPARYRIGISADEKRKDRKEFLVYDHFGSVADEVTREEVEEAGHTLPVDVLMVPTNTEADWYREDEKKDFTKLLDQLEQDDERSSLAIEIAVAEVEAGHQMLVLTHRREHAMRLRQAIVARGVTAGLMLGGKADEADYKRALRGFADGSLRCAVGTIQAVGTGIDMPAISRGVVASPIAANKQLFGQVRGRFCRAAEAKSDAVLYYLYDHKIFGLQPAKNLRAWNRHRVSVRENGQWVDADNWIYERRASDERDALGNLGLSIDMLVQR